MIAPLLFVMKYISAHTFHLNVAIYMIHRTSYLLDANFRNRCYKPLPVIYEIKGFAFVGINCNISNFTIK